MAIACRSPHTPEHRSAYIVCAFNGARQSDNRIAPYLGEPDTGAAARCQASQSTKVPVMVSKSHVFEGMPHVANMFVYLHLIQSAPDITAKNFRTHTRISLAHRNEVSALFRQTHMRDLQFCSTRNALPSLLDDAKAARKDQESEQAIAALLEAVPCLYANVSWPVLRFGRPVGKLLKKILSHPDLREVRLDMYGPTERQIKGVTTSEEAKQSARATATEAHAYYPEVYKGLRQRKASAPLKIDLIYRRTLNESLLESTLEKLRPCCKIGQSIFLRSIDLSDPVSKIYYIESGSFQLWNDSCVSGRPASYS